MTFASEDTSKILVTIMTIMTVMTMTTTKAMTMAIFVKSYLFFLSTKVRVCCDFRDKSARIL